MSLLYEAALGTVISVSDTSSWGSLESVMVSARGRKLCMCMRQLHSWRVERDSQGQEEQVIVKAVDIRQVTTYLACLPRRILIRQTNTNS